MNLVIVESPAKAKTIEKYLGKDYKVLASFGHVRDLPSKNGSVDPEDDFAMTWDVDTNSKKRIKDITDALKNSDKLILATDPDREGEAISWHLLEVLAKKNLSRAPRTGLPRRLYALPCFVAQATRCAFCGPRAVRGASPHL